MTTAANTKAAISAMAIQPRRSGGCGSVGIYDAFASVVYIAAGILAGCAPAMQLQAGDDWSALPPNVNLLSG